MRPPFLMNVLRYFMLATCIGHFHWNNRWMCISHIGVFACIFDRREPSSEYDIIESLMTIRWTNHPPSIIKQLPTSINKRISALSADEQTFHESAPIYQNALRHSNRPFQGSYRHIAGGAKTLGRARGHQWRP